MSQKKPTTPIYPLFIFLFETERFLLETLKNRYLELTQHSKLKTANQVFRKWAKENITYLTDTARDLENSEVHKPKYYKAYQMLFWTLRRLWPNVCLVRKTLESRASASQVSATPGVGNFPTSTSTTTTLPSSQNPNPDPSKTNHPQPTIEDTAILFARFKSPVMLPFAKWWAASQDKREGPLLPAPSFEEAVDRIDASIACMIHSWDAEIMPLLVKDKIPGEVSIEGIGDGGNGSG